MTTRVADRTDEWSSRSFSGGYAGLHALAEESFSGIVTAGRATAAFLNGTVVGVLDGTIEDFEGADGTARGAPSPALPLLMIMQDQQGDPRAKYYSEDTALSAADRKLSDGGFTGYVELSENILSGDYYVVYHGGRSMSAAFVGESSKLLDDDKAFDRADDEVGIYKVYPVDIEPVDIPEPPDDDPDTVGDDSEFESTHPGASASDEDREAEDGPETGATRRGAQKEALSSDDETTRGREPETDPGRTTDTETPARRSGADEERREKGDQPRERRTDEVSARREDGDVSRRTDRAERAATESPDSAAETHRTEETTETDRSRPEERQADGPEQSHPGERQAEEEDDSDRPQTESHRSEERTTEDQPRSREVDRESAPAGRDDGTRATASRDATGAEQTAASREGHPAESARDDDPADPVQDQINDNGADAGESDPLAGASTETDRSGTDDSAEEAGFGETGDLERKSIPSVDPDRTWTGDESGVTAGATFGAAEPADTDTTSADPPQSSGGTQYSDSNGSTRQSGQNPELAEAVRERERTIEVLEGDLSALERERDDLLAENGDLLADIEDLQAELEAVTAERDNLEAEVERLESRLAELEARVDEGESEQPSSFDPSVELSPEEAIDGTNLFIRYGSKGDATLKAAQEGRASREAVEQNLELEYHTQFEAEAAAVDGDPFPTFLESTIQFRFVHWVVHELLYEINQTGHESALRDLYDALPQLDRAELNGSASVTFTEDGEQHREQKLFDVVLRDRMGNPLAVANINDTRNPVTEDMMSSLVTSANRVGESSDTLSGAFFVTSSFFDPDALETAAGATGGGLLSRDKRESYVHLSRKQGYHLCLVEARDDKYHLAVPEL